jgi:mono/diheme cytochrome c family protein
MVSAILVGLALVALYVGLLALTTGDFGLWGSRFRANGERIYATATSDSGQPIVAEMGALVMSTPGVACADCHGPDGRGGTVWMMMGAFQAPDIRYTILTAEAHEGAHEEHPPYNDELIKRAITQGIDPAGTPMAFPMPRWRMATRPSKIRG